MHLTLGRTGNRHRAYSVDTCQRVGYSVVENLVQSRHTLFGLYREEHDRNHVGAKLEDDGVFGIIGECFQHHVELVAHIVGHHVDVVSKLKLQRNHRDVLLALR